jgi:phospho-N-acetylmuramoyl-pentapeptide-transferase
VSSAGILVLATSIGLVATGAFVQVALHRGWGKAVRDDGPGGHLTKAGTPTMGGAAFLVVALLVAVLAGERTADLLALAGLVLASGALGLFDDVLSLRRAHAALLPFAHDSADAERIAVSTGLLARYRLFGQGVVSLLFAGYAVGSGVSVSGSIPVDVLFLAFVVVGSINAFNFTDGLDGLAAGLTVIVLLLFLGSPLAAALAGALLGFLWYNAHPARVFMGGVGSEGLGAAVAGLAILSGGVWWLLVFALLPVLAVLSVIVQVVYFRATGGKRLLRMAPLHHHLELSGWPETRIVTRYWLVTAALVALVWQFTGGLW